MSLSRFLQDHRRFLHDRRANIAPIFALALLPMVGLMGAAVDYSRANAVRTAMQAAVDSTALAVSKNAPSQTADQLTAAAQSYFNALFTHTGAQNLQTGATYSNTSGSQVTVTASGTVNTVFMQMFGSPPIPVNVSSTTTWGMSRLRVALVLDNTGSMASAGKITALKTATKNLLTQLKNAASQNGDVYVSIIPFANDVNVGGPTNYNANWIDWTAWDAANASSGSTSFSGDICYNGTLYVVSGSGMVNGGSCSGTGNGICYNGSLYMWNGSSFYISKSCSNNTNHSSWNGCVTDRTQDYDTMNTPPSTGNVATLFPAHQSSLCPLEIVPQTYNWTKLNQTVDAMFASGTTNQTIGLAWGWLSLSQTAPLNAPALDSNYQYQQIIILLTDGMNTQNRWNYSLVNGSAGQQAIDARTKKVCANIKAAGITLYTIQVNTGSDPVSTMLQQCASDSSKTFMLTSASQIITTFDKIGTNLSKLRIAK